MQRESAKFQLGEKVLCLFKESSFYEAKVEKLEWREPTYWYFIHYKNWKRSWDEWVPEENLFKFSEDMLQKKQTSLAKKPRTYLADGLEDIKPDGSNEKGSHLPDRRVPLKKRKLKSSASTSSSSSASLDAAKQRVPSSPKKAIGSSSSLPNSPRASSRGKTAHISTLPVIYMPGSSWDDEKSLSSPEKPSSPAPAPSSPVLKPCFVNLSSKKEGAPRRHISVLEVEMDLNLERALAAAFLRRDRSLLLSGTTNGTVNSVVPSFTPHGDSAETSSVSASSLIESPTTDHPPELREKSPVVEFLKKEDLVEVAAPVMGPSCEERSGGPVKEERSPTPKSDISLSSTASREMVGKLRPRPSIAKSLADRKPRIKRQLPSRSDTPESLDSGLSGATSASAPVVASPLLEESPAAAKEQRSVVVRIGPSGRRYGLIRSPIKGVTSKSTEKKSKISPKKRLLAGGNSLGPSPGRRFNSSTRGFLKPRLPRAPVAKKKKQEVRGRKTAKDVNTAEKVDEKEGNGNNQEDNLDSDGRKENARPASLKRRFDSDKETDTDSASVYLPKTAKRRKVAFRPCVVESMRLPVVVRDNLRRPIGDTDEEESNADSEEECFFAVPDPIAALAPTVLRAEVNGEKALKVKKKTGRRRNVGNSSTHADAVQEDGPRYHFLEEDEDPVPYFCPLGLRFPEKLREVLYDDWYKVRMDLMLQLGSPAFTVEAIFKEFELYACADHPLKSRKWKDTKEAVNLLKEIFDGIFPKKFLFTFEKSYHGQKFRRDKTLAPSQHYGGCALVRFLSKVGKVMCFSLPQDNKQREAVAKLLQDFIDFVSDRSERYCTFQEYYFAPPAYMRLYMPLGDVGETRSHSSGITR